jgi:hypothetical protein
MAILEYETTKNNEKTSRFLCGPWRKLGREKGEQYLLDEDGYLTFVTTEESVLSLSDEHHTLPVKPSRKNNCINAVLAPQYVPCILQKNLYVIYATKKKSGQILGCGYESETSIVETYLDLAYIAGKFNFFFKLNLEVRSSDFRQHEEYDASTITGDVPVRYKIGLLNFIQYP